MTTVSYVYPLLTFHLSCMIGILVYALKDSEQNRLAGLRTPRTLRDPAAWRAAHREAARVVPPVSAICASIAISGLWIVRLRSPEALLAILGVQVVLLLALAVKWWR